MTRQNAWYHRHKHDPEFRAKRRQQYKKHSPEWYVKRRRSHGQYQRRYWDKLKRDPVRWTNMLETVRARRKKKRMMALIVQYNLDFQI